MSDIHSVNCKFLTFEYNQDANKLHFTAKYDYGHRYTNLWYPCPTLTQCTLIWHDLHAYTFWKVRFHVDNGQIVSMEGRTCVYCNNSGFSYSVSLFTWR